MLFMPPIAVDTAAPQYELRFASLCQAGRGFAFPCDASGRVELDTLSERALANYLFARAVVGRDLDTPVVARLG